MELLSSDQSKYSGKRKSKVAKGYKIMNIAVIGIGGAGGYFGGKLTQLLNDTKDIHIYFIARNKHLEEIKKTVCFWIRMKER